ncbi:MAG: glycosyltransferase, partial [Gemmatimonadetes bacterium]|nr:glycosyltransferase [Gemmatimonadota bacterium]
MNPSAGRLGLAVVAANYPSPADPARGAFVAAFVREIGRMEDVTVIAPDRIRPRLGRELGGGQQPGDVPARVVRPRYPSFSDRVLLGGFSTFRLTDWSFRRAAMRAARGLPRPDVVHGHFLFPAGAAALALAERWRVPATVAVGESRPAYYERHVGLERIRSLALRFAGLLCVSEQNRDYAVDRLGASTDRVLLVRNAADTTRFYPRGREEMRRKLGLPLDRPIAAFVGGFNASKGPLRVLEALRRRPDVCAVFLGSGPLAPAGDRVLFAGAVPHDSVPEWLSAADVFVLPTRAEGSSNAVAEAMACGLPIVTSDLPSMRALVPGDAGLLVAPDDVDALAGALGTVLGDGGRRAAMAEAALSRA